MTDTPDQVVARNLKRAREDRGWTQEEAARRLEPHLGVLWSKATFSSIERSVDGKRIKKFSLAEVNALAATFSLPFAWFYSSHFVPEWTYLEVDGVEVRFETQGSVVTVWAYKETTDKLTPNPAWVEVSEFDVRDYVGRDF